MLNATVLCEITQCQWFRRYVREPTEDGLEWFESVLAAQCTYHDMAPSKSIN
jgi:hypothetical protein